MYLTTVSMLSALLIFAPKPGVSMMVSESLRPLSSISGLACRTVGGRHHVHGHVCQERLWRGDLARRKNGVFAKRVDEGGLASAAAPCVTCCTCNQQRERKPLPDVLSSKSLGYVGVPASEIRLVWMTLSSQRLEPLESEMSLETDVEICKTCI